jgi:hypothetical protein
VESKAVENKLDHPVLIRALEMALEEEQKGGN